MKDTHIVPATKKVKTNHNTVKQIYLIRHGETEFNKKRIVQGSGVDTDLNDTGRLQANAFYQKYKDIAFDKIYISNLKRTYQTVQLFIENLGLTYEKHEGLNEISWGIREGQPFEPEEHQYYLEMIAAWQNGETHVAIEGGESPEDVAERQRKVMDIILSRPEEKNILICMHGRAMRILLTQLLKYPLSKMDIFEHQNTTLYKLCFTGNTFVVEQHNDTTHLL